MHEGAGCYRALPRGSAAAAAANLRRRRMGGMVVRHVGQLVTCSSTDDALGLKISPNVVLVMSIGFIVFFVALHVMGKLYFVRKQ
ncbi:putative protein transport protein SecG/Sec61-beta/Sbh [Helianthus annuus]|nr:putative protein transport protein SecG/Sec61-beta/Sbh [Helianthus annuus]